MNAIDVLEDVLKRTEKNTSRENRAKAISALLILVNESNGTDLVSEYIVKLHYSVTQAFFEDITNRLTDEQILAIVNSLVINEQFLNGNPTNIMYPKGFVSVLALVHKKKYQAAFIILNSILAHKEISEGCRNAFIKFVVDKNGLSAVRMLIEQISNKTIVCGIDEEKRLCEFLESFERQGKNQNDERFEVPSVEVDDSKGSDQQSATFEHQISHNLSISLKSIDDTQREILAKIRNIADNRASIDILTAALVRKENEAASIRSQLENLKSQVEDAQDELKNRDRIIHDNEGMILDLTDRLRNSLKIDAISNNQELNKLKNDISEGLKLDYSDFQSNRDSNYSGDLFEAYRSTLSRIFKLLRRFGISCE